MKPLIVLIGLFLITIFLQKIIKNHMDYQFAGRIAMAAMLVFTAIGHFVYSEGMKMMLPNFISYKYEIVMGSGLLEIFLAIGLLFPKYKLSVGWILIIFLIILLPANIYAAIKHVNYQSGTYNGNGLSYLWFRVPLQLFFILWVYFSTIANYKPLT